jgi:hypothetical protein
LRNLQAGRAESGSAPSLPLPPAPPPAPAAWGTSGIGGVRPAALRGLVQDLRDPRSLQRAFVLKEILGEPVGLQHGLPPIPRR